VIFLEFWEDDGEIRIKKTNGNAYDVKFLVAIGGQF